MVSTDGSSGGSSSFLPAAAMKTYPLPDTGFTPLQLDPKSFPPRKGAVGRVVHICNLPEGSCTENDVINLGLPFGKVTNYILMRSTHQAFLEMAYVEAALAMVQYYQLTPAMINNQKLLIRMSKRYKELQLKKPGKDVETIIHDITSQRDRDELQEHDHYIPERARSRSPIGRALSPHMHSPGFPCDCPESPQDTVCRVTERGTNGLVSHRNSWDWSSLPRTAVDEREDPWQNGSCGDEMGGVCAEERGGSRNWHLQRMSYRNMEDKYFTKELIYKPDKPPRPLYQRHEPKSKRRDSDCHRPRHVDLDTNSESLRAEDKRSSQERGRSKKNTKKHSSTERQSKECTTEPTDQVAKEKSATPQCSTPPKETNDCDKIEEVKDAERAEDTDEECWYPKNMEELVTVDEVGGEDDIIEPDLPELVESPQKETITHHNTSGDGQVSNVKETQIVEKPSMEAEPEQNLKSNKNTVCPEGQKLLIKDLNDFQSELKAMIEDNSTNCVIQNENHVLDTEGDKLQDTETILNGAEFPHDIEALLPSCEQDKAVNEHSIPLGVEFIVPQAGFYCKLCSLFYTSEETAKAAHCRSVVHYRNLQKYLSHLAEASLFEFRGSAHTVEFGFQPLHFCICPFIIVIMAADCQAWLNANPVEVDALSDSGDENNGGVTNKNLNESRLGKGRGLPKKGGAGGKGVWGRSGEVYEPVVVDEKDPNYDEAQENCVYETVVPPLDERDFEKTLTPIVQEYFEHGDTNEVVELLAELNLGPMRSEVPPLTVALALESRASHRELASRLLADLCGPVLSHSDMECSFDRLLQELPDLVLDTPGAPQLVGQFIARAVHDKILSRSYIDGFKGKVDCEYARAALDRAAVLLKMSKGGLRLDSQWGAGGGQRPVVQLIREMNLLLKEFILSGDMKEAERCLRDLEVPHFHHEFVYEAIVMVLESKGERTLHMVLNLLKSLCESTIITVDQLRRGFERVYLDIAEINIDAPRAYFILEQFVDKSLSIGIIDVRLRDVCPSRGRKRFVSEGDGGVIKLESC
ncbi:hypothetical protein WMY93_006516 [Mugilogobius chulae]|uniref:Programmed cell death protein 4 n=1 Tax=Mugilogobius chulae TaxID=88201 RepID=A0AAW0PNY2_9GOBI